MPTEAVASDAASVDVGPRMPVGVALQTYGSPMKIVRWLLQLDDLVPFEVTPRRARLPRALALLLLIATFPDVFIDFQAERLRPVIDDMVEHITDAMQERSSVQRLDETGAPDGRRDAGWRGAPAARRPPCGLRSSCRRVRESTCSRL